MADLTALSPAEVSARIRAGKALLVDIREADEVARERIAGSERPVRRSWPHTESELTTPEMEKKRPLMYSK